MTNSRRPVIAVATCLMHSDPNRPLFKGKALNFQEEKMMRAVWRGGGLPYALPYLGDSDAAQALLEHADGLLLQGGVDVAPSSYGETPQQPEWAGDAVRDAYEAELVQHALERKLPIFGICRGLQSLNVICGGTLYQDITANVAGSLVHRDWDKYEVIEHTVDLEPGSFVAGAYDEATILVNTIHHQSIKQVAPDFHVTARAPDGIIEAIEHKGLDGQFAAAVQWHPEWLDGSPEGGPHRSSGDALFRAFTERCRR